MTKRRSAFVDLGLPVLLAVLFYFYGGPLSAGVADSPLPTLQTGARTREVFIVPGVVKDNQIETEFSCTSLEKAKTITIAVEVFPATGGSPLNIAGLPALEGALPVPPGATVTIATGTTVGIHEDLLIAGLGPASVRNGSARIVSTSKKIACSAYLVDCLNTPPNSMTALTVIGKTRQKGD
ncbi:MAG: hypothetical protein ACE5I7_14100 [Candidatus Binatia bacterium]